MKRREPRSLQASLLLTLKLRDSVVFSLWSINILGLQKVVGEYYAVVSRPEFAIDRTICKDLQMRKIHSHVKCSSFPTGCFRSVPVPSVHFLFPPRFLSLVAHPLFCLRLLLDSSVEQTNLEGRLGSSLAPREAASKCRSKSVSFSYWVRVLTLAWVTNLVQVR